MEGAVIQLRELRSTSRAADSSDFLLFRRLRDAMDGFLQLNFSLFLVGMIDTFAILWC